MTTATNHTPTSEPDSVRQRLRDVGLYGLAVQDHAVLCEPWIERVIDIEDRERKRRSLERRLTNARIGPFKPIADFDWAWPKRIDRALIEELFSLAFVDDATNVVLVGPNGVGKTMLIKNLLHHAVLRGFTARFTTASDMLHELASQDSDASLARRLRRFTGPQLLAIDEVGYLNYDNRYADLLFEVVTRRYLTVPVLISTNKPFSQWADVFSSAACVVTLVDRLIHRSEWRLCCLPKVDRSSTSTAKAIDCAKPRSKPPNAPRPARVEPPNPGQREEHPHEPSATAAHRHPSRPLRRGRRKADRLPPPGRAPDREPLLRTALPIPQRNRRATT